MAVRRAYRQARRRPTGVTLIEAHGTGTSVGDKVEVQALTEVFAGSGARPRGCAIGSIKPGERFLALNDVTTRGNCVNKLGKVITENGGLLAGMMVFARRDSGQFPLMNELVAQHPFYYATDLDMPQWEPEQCPLCRMNKPLLSWKDMPDF